MANSPSIEDIEFLLEYLKPLYPIAARKAADDKDSEQETKREMFRDIVRERMAGVSELKLKAAIQKRFRPK